MNARVALALVLGFVVNALAAGVIILAIYALPDIAFLIMFVGWLIGGVLNMAMAEQAEIRFRSGRWYAFAGFLVLAPMACSLGLIGFLDPTLLGVVFSFSALPVVFAIACGYIGTRVGKAEWVRRARLSVLCPKCRYNLVGLEGGHCPECGWELGGG